MLATWPCSEKLIEHVPFGTSLGRCLVSFWAFGDDFGHRFWCLGQSSRRAARAGLFLGLSGRLLVSVVALFPKTDGKNTLRNKLEEVFGFILDLRGWFYASFLVSWASFVASGTFRFVFGPLGTPLGVVWGGIGKVFGGIFLFLRRP